MSTDTNTCRDLHLRHTDTSGHATVQCHRVWDADRFLAARQSEARDLNAKAVQNDAKAPQRAKVEMITEAEYQKARKQ
jgi:hypothetical protein